jgi:chemotaxis protein methyltransferase CheR
MPAQRYSLIRARLQAKLQARGLPSFTWFHDHEIKPGPDSPGMQTLIDLSTVNHTAFFRELASLRFVVDRLAERLATTDRGPVRVWSAGCSAGQEPYSLAMALAERVPTLSPDRLAIRATDLSLEMIRAGAQAIYDERALADVAPDRLRRFFLRGRGPRQGTYRVVPEIRRLVTFQRFDLRGPDWPVPGDFDAILCRNVAIYFGESERLPLLERLAGRLREGGWLAIGNSEILPDRPRGLTKHAPSIYRKESSP